MPCVGAPKWEAYQNSNLIIDFGNRIPYGCHSVAVARRTLLESKEIPVAQPIEAPVLASAIRKSKRYLLPLLFLMGLICLLDRASVGYASLTMNADLGLSAAAYGFGAGIFFFGYVIFEVPSNMIMQRVGVRVWIARIGISWGIVMIGMGFIWDEWSFYAARLLLGLAEAGLFPAVYFMIGRWFPSATKAGVLAMFLACNAISGIIGGPLASAIFLGADAVGVVDWRALFVVLGLPAIILALIVLRKLPNVPSEASWLTAEEARTLDAEIERETVAGGAVVETKALKGLTRALRNPHVWVFTAIFFLCAMANYGIILFLPQIIQSFAATSPVVTALLSSIPYIAGLVAMLLIAQHSDKAGERRWHFGITASVGAAGLLATGLLLSQPIFAMLGLCVVVAGMMPLTALIWARATPMLAGTAAAAGIAFINAIGSIGGFVGPYLIGWFQELSDSFYSGLVLLAVALLLAAMLTVFVKTPTEKNISRQTLAERASLLSDASTR